jgi:hypothetical protein
MERFLKEKHDFEIPPGVKSWKQNSKVSVEGNSATKTITRTCTMKDGNT